MEDEFSFWNVMGNAFRYQVNRESPVSSFRLGSHIVVIVVITGNRKQVYAYSERNLSQLLQLICYLYA